MSVIRRENENSKRWGRKDYRTIFCKSRLCLNYNASFEAPIYPKRFTETKFLEESLLCSFVFDCLTSEELSEIIFAMKKELHPRDTVLIHQDDTKADCMYVVYTGTVRVVREGKEVDTINEGGIFGELGLLYEQPRMASCVAGKKGVVVYKLDRESFKYIMRSASNKELVKAICFLDKISLLKGLTEEDKKHISEILMPMSFKGGDIIVEKFDIGEVLHIVMEGQVKVCDIGFGSSKFDDHTLETGDVFGERALLTGEPRAATVIALTDCKTMCIYRNEFSKKIGDLKKLRNIARNRILMSTPFISRLQLSNKSLTDLGNSLEVKVFQKDEMLRKIDETIKNQGLYIIEQGTVRIITKNGAIRDIHKGDYFGESTVRLHPNSISDRTILFTSRTTCLVLSKTAIESIAGLPSITEPENITMNNTFIREKISIEDFEVHRPLWRGSFGEVSLVAESKKRDSYCIMRKISKSKIVEADLLNSLIRVINIMNSIEHNLIIKVLEILQDTRNIYIMTNFISGGDLFHLIYTSHTPEFNSCITYQSAQFYAACMLEALSFLHERYICYRDLAPENVFIDADGYCVLSYFGFTKVVMDKTYTMCGGPEYMAPEMVLSRGYNKSVDYWALGVLIFEMISGYTPFSVGYKNEKDLYKRIVKGVFEFPQNDCQGKDDGSIVLLLRDIVEKLLTRNPKKRLGCLTGGSDDVKAHGFFHDLDLSKISFKKIEAPWIPPMTSDCDVSNWRTRSMSETDQLRSKLNIDLCPSYDEEDENHLTDDEQAMFNDLHL